MMSFRQWLHGGDGFLALRRRQEKAVTENQQINTRATCAALDSIEASERAYEAVADLLKRMDRADHD